MYKYVFTLCLTYTFTLVCAQKDTVSKINNLIGIEGGFANRDILIGNKGDVGIVYVYNHNRFLTKSKLSFTPASNFGLLTRIFFDAGFTTKINPIISWNLLGGFGMTIAEKKYLIPNQNEYQYSSISPIIETGLLYKPLKSNHYIIGINCSSYAEAIHYEIKKGYFIDARTIVLNPTLFILYKY